MEPEEQIESSLNPAPVYVCVSIGAKRASSSMRFDEVMFGISPPHFSTANGLLYGHRGVDAYQSTNDFDVLVNDLLRLTRRQRPVVGRMKKDVVIGWCAYLCA